MSEIIESTKIESYLVKRRKFRGIVDEILSMGEDWKTTFNKIIFPQHYLSFPLVKEKERLFQRIDKIMWHDLFQDLPFFQIMSEERKKKIYKSLEISQYDYDHENNQVAEFTEENINFQIEAMYSQRGEMFLDKIEEVYRGLSWNYKTNDPNKIGKRIIVKFWASTWNDGRDKLRMLEDALCTLEGKAILPAGSKERIENQIPSYGFAGKTGENRFMKAKACKNGNVHVEFKEEALPIIEKFNVMLAKRFPNFLSGKNTGSSGKAFK